MHELPLFDREEISSDSPFWRSLAELEQQEDFRRYYERAQTALAEDLDGISRRHWLKLLGASLALAGLSGCGRQPEEQIVPYVHQPEGLTLGRALYYATACVRGGLATGLLVKSHEGRPTKIEGNPKHPAVPAVYWQGDPHAAPGACDAITQAEILNFYDPDRSQTVSRGGMISTWDAFAAELKTRLEKQRESRGAGIRLLTETISSPTLTDQIEKFLKGFPDARWVQYEPCNQDSARAGAELALGRFVDIRYHLDKANCILALDADFLVTGPDHLRHSAEFAAQRTIVADAGEKAWMNRLYCLESTPTLTGAKADHRLPLRVGEIEAVVDHLAQRLKIDTGPSKVPELEAPVQRWLDAAIDDLRNYRRLKNPGSGLVIAGSSLPPRVHALAHAVNQALGAVGNSVTYIEPVAAQPALQLPALRELVGEMNSGKVEQLFILGGNPVYAAPAEVGFAAALRKVPLRVHLGLYEDETSELCDWHLPQAHFLESWDDARAPDGTVSLLQPLIAPLYQGRTAVEVLAYLRGEPGKSAHDMVKQYWLDQRGNKGDFEKFWQTSLHDGVMADTSFSALDLRPKLSPLPNRATEETTARTGADREIIDLLFRPDPTIGDGRDANNGWLQELPKPLTKLTWDNAALLGPAITKRMGIENGDLLELVIDQKTFQVPAWIVPGHPDHSATVHLGYGRWRVGHTGSKRGFNAYDMQAAENPWLRRDVTLRKIGGNKQLACTQHHHLLDGRDLIRQGTLDELRAHPTDPGFMRDKPEARGPSLYPDVEYTGNQWGMTIDLNRCTGCNACVTACQAENNIPIVGPEQVALGRELHWIRVDTYFEGAADNPQAVHQPLPCMHCENAPCEVVCPVGATVHDASGLNEMVYNRCVGTRYCSNNCPYKVRRFNFLQYSDLTTPVLQLLRNPEVTVRNRGVMEKCTYCVQRISAARIDSERHDRQIRDGELVTACQASCPAQAITFGDLNDSASRVSRLQKDPRHYALLGELNTRPRTTYLAALRNPNPALVAEHEEGQHG